MNIGIGKTVLLAGATGQTGKHLLPLLKQHGYTVHVLTRKANVHIPLADKVLTADVTTPETLRGVCNGVDIVFSSVGASLDLMNFRDKRSFREIDVQGNLNLLEEAQKAGVRKMVYVSVFGGDRMNTDYTNAHEEVVGRIKASGLEYVIVRPVGFFYINAEFIALAQKNQGMVIEGGLSRTNPVHEADVAEACAEAMTQMNTEIGVGGPEIFTRREIVEMAFRAIGKQPKIMSVPKWSFALGKTILHPVNKRISALLEFGAEVATQECIAPRFGKRRLEDYFREIAG